MITKWIFLLHHLIHLVSKRYYITYNRLGCSWDQSDCDGSQTRPFSNPIISFYRGLQEESKETSGNLEFYFEAGAHTILPMDFLGQTSVEHRKSPFENYEG